MALIRVKLRRKVWKMPIQELKQKTPETKSLNNKTNDDENETRCRMCFCKDEREKFSECILMDQNCDEMRNALNKCLIDNGFDPIKE